jgi:WD repeat-containing protein 45
MLYRCNIIGIVGGSKYPKYSPNKMILWDDLQHKVTGELTFESKVLAFKMRRDVIAVAILEKVMIFNLIDLGKLEFNFQNLVLEFSDFHQ